MPICFLIEPIGRITFHRQVILDDQFPKWYEDSSNIRDAVVSSSGVIEVDGHRMLEVNNEFLIVLKKCGKHNIFQYC